MGISLLLLPPVVLAGGKGAQEKPGTDESLDEELSELEDADFPDLVGVDDKGELMDEFAFLEEAGVVESAALHRQAIGMSPSAITVITRADIESSGATTIPDLLRMVPGMDVIVSSTLFLAITARMYWNEENNHHLVMIDGREINYDPLGFPPWEVQPVSLEDVERIEVIRGPGSALYGANAMVGVVSITTQEIPEKTSTRIRLDAGEAGRIISGLRASTRAGEWGFLLSGGADLSGTFVDPRDITKRVWKLRALVERRWSQSRRLLIDAGVSDGSGHIATPIGTIDVNFAPKTLRLAYDSENLSGQIYWTYATARAEMDTPLEYAEIVLARFLPAPMESQEVVARVQWTPPRFFEPLLLIVGGAARLSWLGSDDLLDAATFSDPGSPEYHRPGLSHWEIRSGAFVHAELAPTDWVTVTGGSRIDYNTQTDLFVSPRLAAVFQPAKGQFVRVGVARSFRKPSFQETTGHLMVEFPESSPITGADQDLFQEFMTRVVGNSQLEEERLLAFEAGYLGQFLDGRLSVSLDLYYNLETNLVEIDSQIIETDQGLPDLEKSSFMYANIGRDIDILGSELSIRFSPSRHLSLLASWAHREVFDHETRRCMDESPKNLITIGGRFSTESGMVGSLYAFSRSKFWDHYVENPAGLLQPTQSYHYDNVVLILGRLGWKLPVGQRFLLEAGVKLFLPVSPFAAPHFRYYESGGGTTPTGRKYGGAQLSRMVTGYLQGSF